MKLQNILFVISEGEKGLSSVSKLDKKVYEFYNKNKDDFFKICSEIRCKYMDKVNDFQNWLNINKIPNADMIISNLTSINEYAQKTKKTKGSIMEINNVKDFNKFVNTLRSDKFFRIKFKMRGKEKENEYVLQVYSNYLKEINQTVLSNPKEQGKDTTCILSAPEKENDTATLLDKAKQLLKKTPIIAFSVTQIAEYCSSDRDIIKNILYSVPWAVEIKNNFYQFKKEDSENKSVTESTQTYLLVNFSDRSISYAETRPTYLCICGNEIQVSNWANLYIRVCNYLFDKDQSKIHELMNDKPLVETATRIYFDVDIKKLTAPKQLNNGFFAETNFNSKEIIRNTCKLLKRFNLNENNIEIRYILKNANSQSKRIVTKTKITYSNYDYSKYEKILLDRFPRGFKISSSIDNNKFRRFYKEEFEEELLAEDNTLQSIIMQIGIEYEDSRIMAPANTLTKELLDEVLTFIDGSFSDGKSLLYYKSIFQQYESQFLNTNIYNDKILKQVLIHFCNDKYVFKRSYLTNDDTVEIDPLGEVREVLVGNGSPMSYDEIESEMPHIPLAKIKSILAMNNEFINTERSYYTHVDCIDISEDDLINIRAVIDRDIANKGYSIRENIAKEANSIFEKNINLSILGFGNTITYHLKSFYDCNGIIFSPLGENLNYLKIFANYCNDKDTVLMKELENLSKELGFNSLPNMYLRDVFETFSQISRNILVRKEKLSFDTEKTDVVINKFCTTDYIPISYINTFSLFPSSDYHWNEFLLQTYVKNFSTQYFYLGESLSVNKCVGAIVKRSSDIDSYDKILEDALYFASYDELSDEKAALNYLYKNGFIAKRRMSNIDAIMTHAKNLKNQRGN